MGSVDASRRGHGCHATPRARGIVFKAIGRFGKHTVRSVCRVCLTICIFPDVTEALSCSTTVIMNRSDGARSRIVRAWCQTTVSGKVFIGRGSRRRSRVAAGIRASSSSLRAAIDAPVKKRHGSTVFCSCLSLKANRVFPKNALFQIDDNVDRSMSIDEGESNGICSWEARREADKEQMHGSCCLHRPAE